MTIEAITQGIRLKKAYFEVFRCFTYPWGEYTNLFRKNGVEQKNLRHIEVDPVFDADSEYGISFHIACDFVNEK